MYKPSRRVLLLALSVCVAAIIAAVAVGWEKTPVPPEVDQTQAMIDQLRGAGAPVYAPEEFASFQRAVADTELRYATQLQRFFLFRSLKGVYQDFTDLGVKSKEINAKVEEAKAKRVAKIKNSLDVWQTKIEAVKTLTTLMNEGRVARRSLMKSEIAVADAQVALGKGDLQGAEIKLANAEIYQKAAEKSISKLVFRYLDPSQIERWRRTAQAAVAESARNGGVVLVVLKLDRKLHVYRSGKLIQTYNIGIGKNGLADKLYVGDKATPEGRYVISKKVPNSRYYKALLINYPNQEDRQRFAAAKRKGLIPRGRGIGSLVELHGGGPDSVTEGCVSLDNNIMDKIYSIAGVGTPVVIVGTLQMNDLLTAVCRTGNY